jgi:GT2 family glycosyltransferase
MASAPRATVPIVSETSSSVSIIIVSYDCCELLVGCLSSLEEDVLHHGYEVIVVDNGSHDGTVETIAERFPWVEVVAIGKNVGFSRANNLALERASGRHLLLLNPDTVVPKGALDAALHALDAHADVGMLGVRLVQPSGELDHACKRGFPTPAGALYYFLGLGRRRRSRFGQYTAAHVADDQVAFVDAINGAFMLVRREAIAAVGLLDEHYWLYMEDLDWCYRFWQSGWKILYWPGATVTHLKGGSSGGRRKWKANYAFHRGMWLFYRKHYAPSRPTVLNSVVFIAIWLKLGVSAARSVVGRTLALA